MVSTSDARPCNQSAGKTRYRGNLQTGLRCDRRNIQRVVEVKHVRKLRSLSVRQEFAKAFDLSVCSYCLLTYFPIPANIRSGADKFGLDVAELFIKPGMTPAELVSHVCERLKESRNAERFTTNLKTRYEDYQRKQLTFNP